MKILLSAYACEPGRGSEPEVGFQAMLAAADQHEVWVITRANNLIALQEALQGGRLRARIRLKGLDLGPTALWMKRQGVLGLHWYYDRWQAAAGEYARQLDRRIGFDLVHHVTFASHWTRAGVAELDKPFVWGPVGGGVEPLPRLFPVLGVRGTLEDLGRFVLRRFSQVRPVIRSLPMGAALTLVQNEETQRLLTGARLSEVLPNATVVSVDDVVPAASRDLSVAFVARLTPWKGAVLAVRTLRHVRRADAILRIYGDGPDRGRAERAVRALGLEERVLFMGRVSREDLLSGLSRSRALLHPAMHDECPLTVAEALSLGVPVVALNRGGPRELVRWWSESPAALVTPGSPEQTARRLAEQLDRFLDAQAPGIGGGTLTDSEEPPIRHGRTSFRDALLAAYERVASSR